QGEVVRLLRGVERLLRHGDQFIEREQRQVLVRDLGNEQDFASLAGLRRGEVLLQRPPAQGLQAAEKVDLPGGGQADRVVVRQQRTAEGRSARGCAHRRRIGKSAEGRKECRALDPVLRLRLRNGQRGDPQVAVVGQRD